MRPPVDLFVPSLSGSWRLTRVACKAGTTTRFWSGDVLARGQEHFGLAQAMGPVKVGTYPRNPFGPMDTKIILGEIEKDTRGDEPRDA